MYRSKQVKSDENLGAGQDSFLDVVANIVGILIILTALVGARVQHVIAHPELAVEEVQDNTTNDAQQKSETTVADTIAENPDLPPLPTEAQKLLNAKLSQEIGQSASQASSLESQILETQKTIALVDAQVELLNRNREDVALSAAMAKKQLNEKREQLSGSEKEKFDLQQKINRQEQELKELNQSIGYEMTQKKSKSVKKLECYPTAISKTIDKTEIWLQVKNGRVACIPSERLIESFKSIVTSPGNSKTMFNGGRVTATVGPYDGFFLEGAAWTEDKRRISVDVRFIPISPDVGQTIDEAMESMDSPFLAMTRKNNPNTTVITVWVYEDSFEEFQEIEKFLYDSGFRVASRPLPNGAPIGAGPNGSLSAVQ